MKRRTSAFSNLVFVAGLVAFSEKVEVWMLLRRVSAFSCSVFVSNIVAFSEKVEAERS